MRALTSRLRRLGPRQLADERGAVAAVVAILMVPLIGCAAIAVDVSSLYSDRAQLQNAADSAALAIATDCAAGACGNSTATATSALTANAGAADAAGATLRTPAVSFSGQSVTVTVSADQSHWFAPVLGVDSSRVTATATATWTVASTSAVAELPIAISWCEYQKQIQKYPLTSKTPHTLSWETEWRIDRRDWYQQCTAPDGSRFYDAGHGVTDTDTNRVCRTTSSVGDRIRIEFSDFDLPSRCTGTTYLNGLKNKDIQIPVYDKVTYDYVFGPFGIGPGVRVHGYAVYHLVNYQLTYSGELKLYGYFSRGVQDTSGAGSVSLSPQG
jgi:Flp pilus assembly protein TadG